MSNQNKMLQLVLSDEKLSSMYEYNAADYLTIIDALKSNNPVVVTVAKIITGVKGNSDKGTFKETYNEIIGYLNQNLI